MIAVPALTSPLLVREGFAHAFFTREGGVSEGAYASLNASAATGDDPSRVDENLARMAHALGVDPFRLFFLSQVHGVACRLVHARDERGRVAREGGDVVVAREAGVACAVRSADCVPVLVADRASGAVCAIHSGWRGAAADVVGAGVAALRAVAGPRPSLVAAVGPHISAGAFEVGDNVAAALASASPAGARVVVRGPGRPRVDLRALIAAQLDRAGVEAVDHVEGCTVGEPARFFSYRRDGARGGRLLSALAPRP